MAKLGSRGISKRKVKPTWKVNAYLGVGDSDDIGGYAKKTRKTSNVSGVNAKELEMESLNEPKLINDRSSGKAHVELESQTEDEKENQFQTGELESPETDIGFSIKQEETEFDYESRQTEVNSETQDNQMIRNETSSITFIKQEVKQEDGESVKVLLASGDKVGLTNDQTISETSGTDELTLVESPENMISESLFQRSICMDHIGYVSSMNDSTDIKSRFETDCAVYDTEKLQLQTRNTEFNQTSSFLYCDKEYAFEGFSNYDINTDVNSVIHLKPANDTDNSNSKINESNKMEKETRGCMKRHLKPTWKQRDNLGIEDAHKKPKRPRCSTEKTNVEVINSIDALAEVIIETKDGNENMQYHCSSQPIQNNQDVRKKISPLKKQRVNERKDKLEMLRQQHALNFSCSKPLHSINRNKCNFTYYLLPKQIDLTKRKIRTPIQGRRRRSGRSGERRTTFLAEYAIRRIICL